MRTIKELAETLGVSKQAVYARITREPLRSALAALPDGLQTSTRGTVYISEEGAELVFAAYANKYTPLAQRTGGPVPASGSAPLGVQAAPPPNEKTLAILDSLSAQLSQVLEKLETTQQNTALVLSDNVVDTLTAQLRVKDEQLSALQDRLQETTVALLMAQQSATQAQAALAESRADSRPLLPLPDMLPLYNDTIRPIIDELTALDDLLYDTIKGQRQRT